MAGTLYLVPTPVGNLEDITLRAIRVLKEADLILAEDTRTSGVLLKHYDIKTPMQSHHKFNEHKTVAGIVSRLEVGETIALITDAGTPGISDPGFLLSRSCREAGIEVCPIQVSFESHESAQHKLLTMLVSFQRRLSK